MAARRRHPAALLLPVALYFPALHAVFPGSLRYRMAIEPLIALYAVPALEPRNQA